MAKAKAKSAEQDPDRTRIVQRQTVDASAGGIGVKLSGTGRNVRRPTRKARLRIARFDPWSVMKTSFLFSIAAGIILFIAVWVVWGIISLSGALDQAQEALTALVGSSSGSGLELSNYVSQWRVLRHRRGAQRRVHHSRLHAAELPVQPGRQRHRGPGGHPRRGLSARLPTRPRRRAFPARGADDAALLGGHPAQRAPWDGALRGSYGRRGSQSPRRAAPGTGRVLMTRSSPTSGGRSGGPNWT